MANRKLKQETVLYLQKLLKQEGAIPRKKSNG